MNPVDEKRLAEIVERANKATPPPWAYDFDGDDHLINMATALDGGPFESQHEIRSDYSLSPEDGEQFDEAEANFIFIAAAREDLPDLAEALREAWDDNKRLREALERFCSVDPDASIAERIKDAKAACAALALPYQPGDDEGEEP